MQAKSQNKIIRITDYEKKNHVATVRKPNYVRIINRNQI